MRKLSVSSAVLALAFAGVVGPAPSGFAAQAEAAARTSPTHFALKGSGYGSRVVGGDVPTGSDTTAYRSFGCTNKAGLDRENHQLEETIPGLGTASEVKTRVWTRKRGGVVSSYSRNTIARITMMDSPLGSLEINGVLSLSRAFHDKTGFHTSHRTTVQSISFTPPGGTPQAMDLPTPGDPLEIPGVARLAVGESTNRVNREGATVQTDALKVYLTATGSRIRLAHTKAQIQDGLISGVFSGNASGSRAELLDGHVTSGRTPLLVMPCQGTGGEVRKKSITRTDLAGGLLVEGLHTQERANQNKRRAHGYVQASVARLNLGGRFTVRGIVGQVNVERLAGGKLRRTIDGTTMGRVTVDGEPQSFPDTDVLEIPGVAKLERNVVRKVKGGLHVVALRVTLLEGTGAVVNLGEAKLKVRASGN
jgi:hypothetical protein